MRWPKLVREAKTPCTVTIYDEGIDEDGAPIVHTLSDLLCNYQSKAKTIHMKDKTYIEVSGTCLFDGDICPGVAEITDGKAEIYGEKRRIVQASKARNPDGTVNYTRLDLA